MCIDWTRLLLSRYTAQRNNKALCRSNCKGSYLFYRKGTNMYFDLVKNLGANGAWDYVRLVLILSFIGILIAISIVDIKTMEIPNGFVISVLICGIISIGLFPQIGLISRMTGFFCVSLPLAMITFMVPGAFGGGDIKLMAATGVFLGWKLNLVSLLLGILFGGIYGIYLLVGKKKDRKDHFAFGPFLCAGIVVAMFAGETLVTWYIGML